LPGSALSEKARHRFEREVALISGLRHPYVVRLRDSGIASGQYFFAMEYVRGMPLDRYVKSKGLALDQIVELFAKVCDAVAYAHQNGVIHRDLKPANILVDDRGDPRVLDFGLAKVAAGSRSGPNAVSLPSMTGEVKGTLFYMSPEQASGSAQPEDTRTDVYTLGVILYYLATDQFPYDVSGSTTSVLRNIESVEPRRPRQLISKFDSDIETIILKCLAKEPSQRYHSAADLRDEIQRWSNGDALMAKSQSFTYYLAKKIRRHRLVSAVVGLLLLIFVSNFFVSSHFYGQSRDLEGKLHEKVVEFEQFKIQKLALFHQSLFVMFLEHWHSIPSEDAAEAVHRLPPESRESLAAEFLCDPRPLEEKTAEYQAELSKPSPAFWQFVLSEYYRKNGDSNMAIKTCVQCVSPGQNVSEADQWFVNRARGRLEQIETSTRNDRPEGKE